MLIELIDLIILAWEANMEALQQAAIQAALKG